MFWVSKTSIHPDGLMKNEMNYNNKGGRPISPPERKKTHQVNVKLNDMDYFRLQVRAENANMSIPDYVRNSIVDSKVVGRLSVYDNNLIRELTNMGNNLNQIAKKANQAGFDVVYKAYFNLAANIDEVIDKIRYGSKNNS